jgi:hypothetical protein
MKNIFYVAIAALAFISCDKDENIKAGNPGLNQPKAVGFNKVTQNEAYFSNIGPVNSSLTVDQIGFGSGGNVSGNPITITFSIDAANSTAVEGNEFSFPSASRTVTIPAGSTFAQIPYIVNTGSFNATQKTSVVIKLVSSTDGVISEKNKTVTINFVGCSTNLQGSYTTNLAPGTVGNPAAPATVTKIAPNVYRSTRMPGITSGGQPLTFDFTDVCKTLELSSWQLDSSYPAFDANVPTRRPQGVISTTPAGNLTFNNVSLTGLSFYTNRTFTLYKI